MTISLQDRERISNTIRSAEAKTSGEIVCVLAETSTNSTAMPTILAAATALALPWLLVIFTQMTVYRILSLQIVAFIAVFSVLCLPHVRIALMPRRVRRTVAHHAAMEQFAIRGLARKKDRSSILIFVSLAERYARIIADEGIAARVPQSQWQAAIDALVEHMRDGRIAEGFVTAIELCGNELAKQFPRSEPNRNELPDRIYLI
jgi:putative membrane protein